MTDTAKYIVIEYQGVETPIIFPCWLKHSDMANHRNVVGAGFINFCTEKDAETCGAYPIADCYGKSQSLGIESRGQIDSDLINKAIVRN